MIMHQTYHVLQNHNRCENLFLLLLFRQWACKSKHLCTILYRLQEITQRQPCIDCSLHDHMKLKKPQLHPTQNVEAIHNMNKIFLLRNSRTLVYQIWSLVNDSRKFRMMRITRLCKQRRRKM